MFTIHYIVYKSLSLSSFSTLRYKCVTNISWVLTSTSCGSHFCIVVLYLHWLDVTVLKGRARQDFASIIGFYLLYWLASQSMYRIRDAYARVSPKANLSSKRYIKFSLEIRLFVKILKAGVAIDCLLYTVCVSISFY